MTDLGVRDAAASKDAATVAEIADRVVGAYLGIAVGERFAIVVDARTDREIPDELVRATLERGGDPVVVTIAPRARSGTEPPAPAAAAMAAADVVLCAASTSLYHTTAKAAAQRAGARGVFNAPYRADAWRNGAMTADFVAVRRRAETLAALWRTTREVRITSPAGTDLRATVTGREPMAWLTGICRNAGEVSALPGGEVSLPPLEGTTQGVVVWERVASDLGALEAPVTITIRDGRAVADRGRTFRRSPAGDRGRDPRRRQHRRDRDRPQSGGPHRRRDHRGQEGVRDRAHRPRRFGQRVRRPGRVRGPPRRSRHGADDRIRWRGGRRRRATRLRGAGVSAQAAATGPLVTTPYPGPRARAVIERMRAVEGAGPRTGGDDPPLVVEKAAGSILTDPDGNRYVDLAGSFAAATIGHSHPAVTAAVRDQIERASHVSSGSASEARVAFEEALVDIAPPGLDRVLLGLSGSDANDTAVKLARTLTGRHEVIAFSGGYLGRSSGVIGLNGKSRFRDASGIAPDAHFLPYPYAYRWPLGADGDAGSDALALVRHAIEDPASGIGLPAAIVVESVQGNGGIVIPPDGFLAGLRDLATRHGIVLIFDEIQCGFGRTGRTWASEHWGVVPDLMTVGKGIGGGLAVSAVVGRAAFMTHWTPGTHTSTFMAQRRQPRGGLGRDRRPARRAARGTVGGARARACSPGFERHSPTNRASARSAAWACSSASRSSRTASRGPRMRPGPRRSDAAPSNAVSSSASAARSRTSSSSARR